MSILNTTLYGDAKEKLCDLALELEAPVQMCVTSPPYWGLRDYGVEGQLGLEATPDEYVANMVEVFRLVRDVLADDGTLWLNLGDSYATGAGKVGGHPGGGKQGENWKGYRGTRPGSDKHSTGAMGPMTQPNRMPIAGLKPKDLVGIPWRVAFALQADGWYLRQDIIWHKPNPMPESVRDRCTKAHEYLFLLSKSERYCYDHKAIMETAIYGEQHAAKATSWGTNRKHPNKTNVADYAFTGSNSTCHKSADGKFLKNKRSVWTIATKPYKGAHFATFPPALIEPCILAGSRPGDVVLDPFMGSGTTAQVCKQHGRQWIGIDLNPDNEALQQKRVESVA